jgi:hypothetical protein
LNVDQRRIDAMRRYYIKLDKKKKPKDQIIIGAIDRFNPNRAEGTEAFCGGLNRYVYKNYRERRTFDKILTKINNEQSYHIEIVGKKLFDKKGKCYGAVLDIAENKDLERTAIESEKPRDGYNEKIKRCIQNAKDPTLKKRIKKLVQEIEA